MLLHTWGKCGTRAGFHRSVFTYLSTLTFLALYICILQLLSSAYYWIRLIFSYVLKSWFQYHVCFLKFKSRHFILWNSILIPLCFLKLKTRHLTSWNSKFTLRCFVFVLFWYLSITQTNVSCLATCYFGSHL